MNEALAAVLIFFFIFLAFVIIAVAIAMYILTGFAYQKAMRILKYKYSWMAWIPYAKHYALADAASEGKDTMKLFNANCPVFFFKFWFLLSPALTMLPFAGPLAAFVYKLFFQGSVYRAYYEKIDGKSAGGATTLGFFSTVITLIPVIKFLSYKLPQQAEEKPQAEAVPMIEEAPAAAAAPEEAAETAEQE